MGTLHLFVDSNNIVFTFQMSIIFKSYFSSDSVAQAYLNQKRLDAEAKQLHASATNFAKQTQQWMNLIEGFSSALKVRINTNIFHTVYFLLRYSSIWSSLFVGNWRRRKLGTKYWKWYGLHQWNIKFSL